MSKSSISMSKMEPLLPDFTFCSLEFVVIETMKSSNDSSCTNPSLIHASYLDL
jgi:hypothetical protein